MSTPHVRVGPATCQKEMAAACVEKNASKAVEWQETMLKEDTSLLNICLRCCTLSHTLCILPRLPSCTGAAVSVVLSREDTHNGNKPVAPVSSVLTSPEFLPVGPTSETAPFRNETSSQTHVTPNGASAAKKNKRRMLCLEWRPSQSPHVFARSPSTGAAETVQTTVKTKRNGP